MSTHTLTLGKAFGISIRINISWALIAFLVAWSLAEGFFPALYEGLPAATYWWMAVTGVLGLGFSIIAHELSHSLVGRLFGMQVKTITLFLFGGAAQLEDEPSRPGDEILMAAAGPAMSLALSGLFNIVAFVSLGLSQPLSAVFGYLAILNLILAIFNCIPAFPMDGGRVLRALLWLRSGNRYTATRTASRVSLTFSWILAALGLTFIILGDLTGGLWWILISLFLRVIVMSSWQQEEAQRVLHGHKVREIMTRDPDTVPAHISLRELIEQHIYRTHHEAYPVMSEGTLAGMVGVAQLRETPSDQWDTKTVSEVMIPLSSESVIDSDLDAVSAMRQMQSSGHTRMPVTENSKLVGVLTLKDLMQQAVWRQTFERQDSSF